MNDINTITLYETIIFFLVIIILLLIGFILWYFLWIKNLGVEIPYLMNSQFYYFSSRNISLIIENIYSILTQFDIVYIIKTLGYEAYVFLMFQRKILNVFFSYFILSIILFICNNYCEFLFSSSDSYDSFKSICNITSIILITFLHFRIFHIIKKTAYYNYFSRFDKMSQNYDVNWLTCRTLHISGIAPEERNTSSLQRKLNDFLNKDGGNNGKIIDINFIPNYTNILILEKQKNEINDLKKLIKLDKNCLTRCFNNIYWSNESMEKELNRIEEKIEKLTLEPVYSSGHAFICFDSLKAAYKIINEFKETPFSSFKVKLKSLLNSTKKKFKNDGRETFQKFNEEYDDAIDDNIINNNNDIEKNINNENKITNKSKNVNILVDQLIDPSDIIWKNLDGDKGLYFFRRIILNLILFLLLIFFTTPMSLFSMLKKYDKYKVLQFNWIINIPYGYILITYIVPLIILAINLGLIVLIDFICRFEKYFTHSSYQYAVFSNSYLYILLNFLIIPSLTLSYEPLYTIIKNNYKDIFHLLNKISDIYTKYYFYITLIIQNGTLSFIYYLLRLDELFFEGFSTQITFYKRHFINTGHNWHRNEADCFYYGYFYAQYMVFYTIVLVFSQNSFVVLSGIYLFLLRHVGDFSSLLMVHLIELDSNGKLINHIINYNLVPILLFHMFSIFNVINKKSKNSVIIIIVLMISSIIYYFINYNNDYILDIYNKNKELTNYEKNNSDINRNEINKWINKFRHPLVLPVFVDDKKNNNNIENNNIDNNIMPFEIEKTEK